MIAYYFIKCSFQAFDIHVCRVKCHCQVFGWSKLICSLVSIFLCAKLGAEIWVHSGQLSISDILTRADIFLLITLGLPLEVIGIYVSSLSKKSAASITQLSNCPKFHGFP